MTNSTRSATPCRAALSRATAIASGATSVATIRAVVTCLAIATAMAPEPVPTSSRRIPAGEARQRSIARTTSPSVSGRGTSTAGLTENANEKNSRCPTR